jgi:hypothetical protein
MVERQSRVSSRGLRIAGSIAAMAIALLMTGCCYFRTAPRDPMALNYGDRCFIEDSQYVHADQLYARMGSLALVERQLRERDQWQNCEVNEALYRLRKVHRLP